MNETNSLPIMVTDDTQIVGYRPVIVIGPNGSGKTRFGHQLATRHNAEFIAAVRNIILNQAISMLPLPQAMKELNRRKLVTRRPPWQLSDEIDALFAKLMAEDSASALRYRDARLEDPSAEPEHTKLMDLRSLWEKLFPGRRIRFDGYAPVVLLISGEQEQDYPAQQMSDGERAAMFLAARVLDANPGLVVIDEPEVHFHARLASGLWDELERLRPDCRFVYITHDVPFALSRRTQDFILMREGQVPEVVSVSEGIPQDLAQQLLSAASFSIHAQRLVFCEGARGSHDHAVLSGWFYDPLTCVIPVGSARDVIRCTQTFREERLVTGVKAIGIIDRDYWPDEFLDTVPDGVTVLEFSEIESLLCYKPVFQAVAVHQGKDDSTIAESYDRFLTAARRRFTEALYSKQVSERFRCRCERQSTLVLNQLTVTADLEETRESHLAATAPENWIVAPEVLFEEENRRLTAALRSSEGDLLRYFPGKVYLTSLVSELGLNPIAYRNLIVGGLTARSESALYTLGQALESALVDKLPSRRIGLTSMRTPEVKGQT